VSTIQMRRCIACSTTQYRTAHATGAIDAHPSHRPRAGGRRDTHLSGRRPTAMDSPAGARAVRVTSSRPSCPGSTWWTASGPSR
jgi:hypothetical protein